MKTVVNLTQELVIGEIDSVLDTYPYQPYQQAFAIPDLRQELISFVFNRLPCFYQAAEGKIRTTEPEPDSIVSYKLPRNPLQQQLHIQNLIHQGISAIFKEKADFLSHHLSDLVHPDCEPSHWFG